LKVIYILIVIITINTNASELMILKKACNNKISEACFELSILYKNGLGVDKNQTLAKYYLVESCDYGYKQACATISDINSTSYNIDFNKTK